MFLIPVLADYI